MTSTGYIETYNGYDLYCDEDGVHAAAWYALPELPGGVGTDDAAGVATYPSRRALRRAIDATYEAPGGAS